MLALDCKFRGFLMFKAFAKCDSGVAAIEFILIASVMALALIVVMPMLADGTTKNYSSLAGHISTGI
jgi:Flp pilus assembly pilin Flp